MIRQRIRNIVSALHPGYCPKLSGSAGQVLNGQGNWVTVGGGTGTGLVLLAEYTASNQTDVQLLTRNAVGQSGNLFQSDFDDYLFKLINVNPVSPGGQSLFMEITADGGVTWGLANQYYYGVSYLNNANSGGSFAGGPANSWTIFTAITNTLDGVSGSINLYNPASSQPRKSMRSEGFGPQASFVYLFSGMGTYIDTTALTGVRFLYNGLNTASGTIRCYGYSK